MADSVRFQHFEVLRKEDGSLFELGRGAMGITYKAFDTNLRCFVALKVINAAYLNSEVARQRFLREARAAAALRHPNVATVFHLGSEEDNYFYAMEFVDGETVEAFMKREGAVPTMMALEIVAQVSRALGAAQKQGLVHRDIKPSNLMVVREDGGDLTVKVIDFGLAKSAAGGEDSATLTAGGFLGTPHFASPEQLEEREIDVRSDIYSLGVTLWFMLAGKTPFSGSLAQVMSQHLHREPPFESLEGQPDVVVRLLRHMMAKDPAGRPQTPAALRSEIEGCLQQVGHGAPPAVRPVSGETFETTLLPDASEGGAVELLSGLVLAGRYRLLEEVTASDHGRMFRAERVEDRTVVAVLILHSGRLTTSEAFTRLEQEVENLQKLRHPAFQKILSLENANHHTFLALEWVEGPTVLDVLRTRRALPVGEAKSLLVPLAEAFDELADAGLSCPDIAVHEVWLTDGDLARPKFLPLTGSGGPTLAPDATLVASSFAMMKASGAFAGNPDHAYVYAVAALAYEILGGVRGGSSADGYVPIPGLSEEGNTSLRRALSPGQAQAGAREFVAELVAAAPATPTIKPLSVRPAPVVTPPPLPVPPELPRKKSFLPWILTAVGLVVLLAGGAIWQGVVLWQRLAPSGPAVAPSEPNTTPTPEPEPTPDSQPTPEATPTPDPRQQAYEDALTAARAVQREDNVAGALEMYAAVAEKFPEESAAFTALENLAANVRARAPRMSADELAALRPPLERAAGLNTRSAQVILGEMLRQSDPPTALKWFEAAAHQGQTEAMVYAGEMLARGRGLGDPNLTAAAAWFAKAADLGDPEGLYALAECHLYGKGVEKDPKRAVQLLAAAATLNNPRAMSVLGDVYRRGIPGVLEPNAAESLRLFSQAKELGFLDAQGNLGVLYMNGEGVPRDEKMAVELFRDGAEKNNPACMYFYAKCLEGGVVVEKNPDQARDWYLKAARAGNKPALDWCKKNAIPVEP